MKKIRFSPICSIIVFLSAIIFSIQTVNAQAASKDWIGSFEFFDGQKGGPPNRPSDFITYTLVISQKGDALTARFTADGTQTFDEYECRIESSGNSIKIYFLENLKDIEDDEIQNFKKGQLLFTLTKTKIGKKIKYLFKAGDYQIDLLSARAGTPIYFKKIK
ncbi:MAG: DUF5991 domain-containing protein [Pyrinomonadaceae bacterium]